MKRMRKPLALLFFAATLLFASITSQAAGFDSIYTNDSWETDERTVGKTEFLSTYNNSTGTNSLKAIKNGVSKLISDIAESSQIVTDGNTVYYCVKENGNHYLHKYNLKEDTDKRIRKLAGSKAYSISLVGKYKNDVYYIIDMPEGQLAKVNVKTKKIKKIVRTRRVTNVDQQGRYLLLSDGTGAGYSYLGVWNAAKGKFSLICKKPFLYKMTSKYVYYVEVKSGNMFAGKAGITIKRYSLKSGKKKTLVKKLSVRRIEELTSKYVKYMTINGTIKTKKW